ncbi:M48 family metalloprotease [bacterium]|nr:M48 family metalloprotease [bacterium]
MQASDILTNTAQPSINTPTENIEIILPELGDSASSSFSLNKEYQLGRAWLKAFRSQVSTVSDPQLQDYVETLIYKLATYSELKDRRLDIVIVNNKSINAFAVPGGVVGVHNGLILNANNEGELASVLSHELAHLSQRHFSRSVEAQKRNAIPNMAGLLAGILLGATAGADAGMAAITASQAASLQKKLRYSRLNEQEADREGMQTMVRANMDPNATAAMFETMMKLSRYAGNRPPEFLLTHPLTESRVSDAKNRARQYQRKVYVDNPEFQIIKARIELGFMANSNDAVKRFRIKTTKNDYPEAAEYGLVLALTANSEYKEAQERLTTLLNNHPNSIHYIIAQAELLMAQSQYDKAILITENALKISPENHSLTMTLSHALLKANEPQKAEVLLQEHVKIRPNDPDIWYLLAETYGLAGNIIGVHRARAEYFVLNGQISRATKQLSYALPLTQNTNIMAIKIQERMREIKAMEKELESL